jgi:hypothetical protein
LNVKTNNYQRIAAGNTFMFTFSVDPASFCLKLWDERGFEFTVWCICIRFHTWPTRFSCSLFSLGLNSLKVFIFWWIGCPKSKLGHWILFDAVWGKNCSDLASSEQEKCWSSSPKNHYNNLCWSNFIFKLHQPTCNQLNYPAIDEAHRISKSIQACAFVFAWSRFNNDDCYYNYDLTKTDCIFLKRKLKASLS